jgi:threonine/homoserine/homoserine lactone efflux protein
MIAAFAGFAMGFIGSMPVAGHTSLLVFHRGMLARYRDGWAIGLGGGLVEGIYCAIAVHAFSTLRDNLTFFTTLTKVASALLLLALGLYFIFSRQGTPQKYVTGEPSRGTWGSQFCIGLSIAAFNPTLILTWSASVAIVFPIINLSLHFYESIGFVVSAAMGIVAWFSILLILLRRFRDRFPSTVIPRVIRTVGLGFVASSMVLAARLIFGWSLFWVDTLHYANHSKWFVL